MANDFIATSVPDGELQRIVAAVAQLDMARQKVEALTEHLKEAKAEVDRLEQKAIPDLMSGVGMTAFTLKDGRKVTIGQDIFASITEANAPRAFAWLRQTGNDSIIRHTVGVLFGKGDDTKAQMLAKELIDRFGENLEVLDKEQVHPQTLKAFVRECIRDEVAIPEDAFGVRRVNYTEIGDMSK